METQSSSKKENILIIAYNDLNNSGVPNVIYQIVKSQHNKYNFDIITFGDNEYYYKKLISEGIKNVNVIKFNIKKPNFKIFKILFYLSKEQKIQYKMALKLLKKKKYKAVHSFKEYDSGPFLKAAKKLNISKRIVHSTVIHSNKEDFITKKRKKSTLKYGNLFVGVTDLCCKNAFGKNNYDVIHFSYDESTYNSNVKNKLNNKQLVLTQVGTFSTNKNQLFSIEILNNLKIIYPESKLKLIGVETEKDYLKNMTKKIKESHLESNIEIIDGSNGVGDNLQYISFTLLTSIKEGASLVVVESQACGIDVFASSCVSEEMNLGGITFLDLSKGPGFWAQEIYKKWLTNKNSRHLYNTSSFSKKTFKENISNLYSD